MAIGISSGCFYPHTTEEALHLVGACGADCTELFVNSPHELEKTYIEKFREIQKMYGYRVRSFHTYASFTESYYYFSSYTRRFTESIEDFKQYFDAMHALGAEVLVMHGAKIPGSIPDEAVFERFGILSRLAKAEGILLCQENVAKYRSQSPDYLLRMSEYLGEDFHMVFDIKQARKAQIEPQIFLDALLPSIVHIHISDYTKDAPCALPFCQGSLFDFPAFFKDLQNRGYQHDYMLEVYDYCYKEPQEIKKAYRSLQKCL